MENLTIIDTEYKQWVKNLVVRYRQSQIKAAIKVNTEQILFNLSLGKDIAEREEENIYGSKFYATLSRDLKEEIPDVEGLSESNIRYCKRFYLLYCQTIEILPQVVEELDGRNLPQVVEDLCSIPWGHHRLIIDRCSDNPQKALFFVCQTLENGWSRAMLLNWIDTGLYERQGKAISNFASSLPAPDSDLAQEVTKDPYSFAFAGVRGRYNEKKLKEALLSNITNFLVELGSGFSYVGREYRLQIGEKEKFIDLLFYHLKLRCYVVVEVKIDDFDFPDVGQLGGYIVACNHILKRPDDNPTIGLLICKKKNGLLAQYSLESSNQPIAISSYELEQFYPVKVEGSLPTIEEIESKLGE
jgi:predicted nuclease of restriction endonuclease-like (RecB) superfamily